MTPVVISIAVAVAAAVVVLALVPFLTGDRLPAPRELVTTMRSGLQRPRETFAIEDDVDGPAGEVRDVFAVGRAEHDVPRP